IPTRLAVAATFISLVPGTLMGEKIAQSPAPGWSLGQSSLRSAGAGRPMGGTLAAITPAHRRCPVGWGNLHSAAKLPGDLLDISVILPAKNEAAGLRRVLPA